MDSSQSAHHRAVGTLVLSTEQRRSSSAGKVVIFLFSPPHTVRTPPLFFLSSAFFSLFSIDLPIVCIWFSEFSAPLFLFCLFICSFSLIFPFCHLIFPALFFLILISIFRCIDLLREHPGAARTFYANLSVCAADNVIAKFVVVLSNCIRVRIHTDTYTYMYMLIVRHGMVVWFSFSRAYAVPYMHVCSLPPYVITFFHPMN